MGKFLVLLLAVVFTVSLIAGCGQRQEENAQKPVVIKSADIAVEDMDEAAEETEEVEVSEEAPAEPAATAPGAVEAPKAPEAPKPVEALVIADFNSGEKPNNLGGNLGAWNKDPSDPTQWCKEGFDNAVRHGEAGFSMKLDYSVDSPNPAYNGFWMMLPNFDASKYDGLSLWVKGDPKAGYSTVFKIELKNANKQLGRYYVSNVSDQWQEVSIPLSEFKGLIDRSNLTEFVIVFEDRMATNKKGALYVDDITFTKSK